eukprot:9482140-Lingulodinium_polyedra.AAC.1
MSLAQTAKRTQNRMPANCRSGQALLNRGEARGRQANDRADAATWIARRGPELGLRPPNLGERSRATGTRATGARA